MRKLLIAVCITGGLVLVTDAASARARGIGAALLSSKPSAAKIPPSNKSLQSNKSPQSKAAPVANAKARSSYGTIIVPIPGRKYPASSAAAAPGTSSPAVPLGAFAAAPRADAATPPPAAKEPEPATAKAPEPQRPAPLVIVNPTPPQQQKQAAAGPPQPHKYALCYWNRAGQCVP